MRLDILPKYDIKILVSASFPTPKGKKLPNLTRVFKAARIDYTRANKRLRRRNHQNRV